MIEVSKKAVLKFTSETGARYNVGIDDPEDDIDGTDAKRVMKGLAENGVFVCNDGSQCEGLVGAVVVKTVKTTLLDFGGESHD